MATTTKSIKGVFVPRHDTAINWSKATKFIPSDGELIVFSIDDSADVARGYYVDTDGNTITTVTVGSTAYPIAEPSDKVRFKFGNGKDNVNVLPFATATGDGYVTYDEMVAYVSTHGGAGGDGSNIVVYLDEEHVMGRAISMNDVYPIQHDMEFEIRSRNLFNPELYHATDGIDITVTNGYTVTVSGNTAGTVQFDEIYLPTEGSFSIYTEGAAVKVNFMNDAENISTVLVQPDDTYTFNAEQLGVKSIVLVYEHTGNTSVALSVQVEAGDTFEQFTEYIAPGSNLLNCAIVYIYGKNLADPVNIIGNTVSLSTYTDDTFNVSCGLTSATPGITTVGQKYAHFTSDANSMISIPGIFNQYVALPVNTDFTILYTVTSITDTEATVSNIMLVLGHITEAAYEEYLLNTIISDENGLLSNDFVQYPYCTAVIDLDTNENVTLYAKYDPAINQETIDQQFEEINRRLDALEAGGVGGGSNVVVSDTEPTDDTAEVWIQPANNLADYIAVGLTAAHDNDWTYTQTAKGIATCAITLDYNKTITSASDRTITLHQVMPYTFKYKPSVLVTLSNVSGDEHWVESVEISDDNYYIENITLACLSESSATVAGTFNIMVMGTTEAPSFDA